MGWSNEVEIDVLNGAVVKEVHGAEAGSSEITLDLDDGRSFSFLHIQDCCESVYVESIDGDVSDIIGTPLTMVEKVTNSEKPCPSAYCESFTWTFYKLGTAKGSITIRWLGESNGWYSESVDLVKNKFKRREK